MDLLELGKRPPFLPLQDNCLGVLCYCVFVSVSMNLLKRQCLWGPDMAGLDQICMSNILIIPYWENWGDKWCVTCLLTGILMAGMI